MSPLRDLNFDLQPWTTADLKWTEESAARLGDLAEHAGTRGPLMDQAIERMRVMANAGPSAIAQAINHPRDVIAYARMLAMDDLPATPVFSGTVARSIKAQRGDLSGFALRQFVRAYLANFGAIRSEGLLTTFESYLRKKLRAFKPGSRGADLERIAGNAKMLIAADGPAQVADAAVRRSQDLAVLFRKLGLDSFGDGAYLHACRGLYIVRRIDSAAPGQPNAVLDELNSPSLLATMAGPDESVGLLALRTLIRRIVEARAEPGVWLDTILRIAGDPRTARGTARYQRYWGRIATRDIDAVRRWLSSVDVRLFLRVIGEAGADADNESLQRMYPARRKFLEGLLEQGLVRNTRLFLSKRAERYLSRILDDSEPEAPEFARVNNGDASMIYLQVGDAHVIEGSHSWKLRIFPRMPSGSELLNLNRSDFDRDELRRGVVGPFHREFPELLPKLAEITHNGDWEKKAVKALRNVGVTLDAEALLPAEQYVVFKQKEHL